jgi:Spy/CpxP family protein refolding chaperone
MAVLLATAWTLATDTMSWADGHGHGGHRHGRPNAGDFIWHVIKAKEAVGLSEEQETRLRTIGVAFKKDRVKRDAEVELAEIDLHQLFHQQEKQASGGNVENAIRKLYALKADRRIASFNAFQEARGVLTPEQLKKLRELHEKGRCSMDGERSESHGDTGQPGEGAMSGGRPAVHQ